MKTAFVTFESDGTMTLVCGDQKERFDSLSRLVNYCRDNNIQVWPKPRRTSRFGLII